MNVGFDQDGRLNSIHASGLEAVNLGAELARQQISSQTRLKLGLYILAAFFLIVSALLVVFAPSGREGIAYVIGATLFAIGVGSAGYTKFLIKGPGFTAKGGG